MSEQNNQIIRTVILAAAIRYFSDNNLKEIVINHGFLLQGPPEDRPALRPPVDLASLVKNVQVGEPKPRDAYDVVPYHIRRQNTRHSYRR